MGRFGDVFCKSLGCIVSRFGDVVGLGMYLLGVGSGMYF